MGLSESVTESGLILLEREDGAAVAQALRDYDSELNLRANLIAGFRDPLWRVYRTVGSEHRDVFVTAWQDAEGKPLPLSMRLLDRIKELDRNTRSESPDAERLNEKLRQKASKDRKRALEAIRDDHLPQIKTDRLSIQIPAKLREKL